MNKKERKLPENGNEDKTKIAVIVTTACIVAAAVVAGILVSSSPESAEKADKDIMFANEPSDIAYNNNAVINSNGNGESSVADAVENANAAEVAEADGFADMVMDVSNPDAANTQVSENAYEDTSNASAAAADNDGSGYAASIVNNTNATDTAPSLSAQSAQGSAFAPAPAHVHSWKSYETIVKDGYYDTVDKGTSRKMIYVYNSIGNVMNQFLPANRADAEAWAARYGYTDIREVEVKNTCTLWYSPVYEYGKKCVCGAKQVEGTRGGNSTTIAGHV